MPGGKKALNVVYIPGLRLLHGTTGCEPNIESETPEKLRERSKITYKAHQECKKSISYTATDEDLIIYRKRHDLNPVTLWRPKTDIITSYLSLFSLTYFLKEICMKEKGTPKSYLNTDFIKVSSMTWQLGNMINHQCSNWKLSLWGSRNAQGFYRPHW